MQPTFARIRGILTKQAADEFTDARKVKHVYLLLKVRPKPSV